ncbi:M28 family peptidase [Thermodesulfobacteriota bacterium]
MKTNPYDIYLTEKPTDPAQRAGLLLDAIVKSVERQPHENVNEANIRHMEDFFSFLKDRFPTRSFQTEIQSIPKKRVRTTDRNFIVTVPGKTQETLIFVAHYDTWALTRDAPGADDNTSGEEVLKQYLLRDLSSPEPPSLTHVYLFSGSEECGSRGLISQFGLVLCLTLISSAISSASLTYLLLSIPFLPFLNYRFGITGTRQYVDNLSDEEKGAIRAAIAVDAVGEGRLYIMENEMGANFLRALFPYDGSEELNDLLEEGAHIHGIKYNRFLSGGTTDSVAFLEERKVLKGKGKRHYIPAAAILTMAPGKCSPLIRGGKLHTANDTPDRVYTEPLREVLTVLDYAIDILEGGERPPRPREIDEHHYARLYRDGTRLFVAMKDAIEPNRRNINSIFRVEGRIEGPAAELTAGDLVGWGVETTLDKEMKDFRPNARQVEVKTLEIRDAETSVFFKSPTGFRRRLKAWASGLLGRFEHTIGRYSFLTMFVTALLVAVLSTRLLDFVIEIYPPLGLFVGTYYLWVFFAMIIFQLAVLFRLITRELPTWMDNAYKHENRADNLQSLRRAHRP